MLVPVLRSLSASQRCHRRRRVGSAIPTVSK
jgi:hypothetical protein